jgi:hypothetical protein
MTKKPTLTDEELQQKAEELGHSRPLYPWRVGEHPEVKDVIAALFVEMEEQGLVSKRYGDQLRSNLTPIVLDLYVAYLSDPKLYVAYSRHKNDYGKGSRNEATILSYSHVVNSIDFLISNQYAEGTKGQNYQDEKLKYKNRLARMRATEKLIHLFKEKKVVPRMMKRDKDEPLLILRDKKKKQIDYVETEETRQMTENLKVINKALEKWAVLLYVTDAELEKLNERMKKNPDPGKRGPIDFTNKRLRRIFNNSRWDHGGRFFGGWWQNIPREYRKYIRLDDKHVVECDYSGLHINMLYAMEKLPMPKGDVYHLKGYSNDETFRKFVKQMLLIMVNSKMSKKGHRWETARKAIQSAVSLTKELELPSEIPSTKGQDIFPVMDAFERKHEKIQRYLCTGIGIDLQNLDSKMAEKVMLTFSKGQGMQYAILPLHDSFVIHHGWESFLKKTMQKAFREVFGCTPKVDLKYHSLAEWTREHPPDPNQRHYHVDFKKVAAEKVPYSVYHQLLNEHWKSKNPQKPEGEQETVTPWDRLRDDEWVSVLEKELREEIDRVRGSKTP